MIRSVLAVVAGIATLTIASFAIEGAADWVLMHLFPTAFPDHTALGHSIPAHLVMFVYTFACIALGGYVTAWIAERAPIGHAVVMGAIESGLTIWAMASLPLEAPLWAWITGIVFAVPAAWLGGAVYVRYPAFRAAAA
jgi:hypothetical protein